MYCELGCPTLCEAASYYQSIVRFLWTYVVFAFLLLRCAIYSLPSLLEPGQGSSHDRRTRVGALTNTVDIFIIYGYFSFWSRKRMFLMFRNGSLGNWLGRPLQLLIPGARHIRVLSTSRVSGYDSLLGGCSSFPGQRTLQSQTLLRWRTKDVGFPWLQIGSMCNSTLQDPGRLWIAFLPCRESTNGVHAYSNAIYICSIRVLLFLCDNSRPTKQRLIVCVPVVLHQDASHILVTGINVYR